MVFKVGIRSLAPHPRKLYQYEVYRNWVHRERCEAWRKRDTNIREKKNLDLFNSFYRQNQLALENGDLIYRTKPVELYGLTPEGTKGRTKLNYTVSIQKIAGNARLGSTFEIQVQTRLLGPILAIKGYIIAEFGLDPDQLDSLEFKRIFNGYSYQHSQGAKILVKLHGSKTIFEDPTLKSKDKLQLNYGHYYVSTFPQLVTLALRTLTAGEGETVKITTHTPYYGS